MELEILLLLIVLPVFTVWLYKTIQQVKLKKEIKRLKEHLHTKMEIDAEGYAKLKADLEEFRKQNENLRVTNHTLQNKPGRKELLLLYVYDKALHEMISKNPSIAPVWEEVYQKAEREINEIESGMKAYVSRVFRKSPTAELSSATKQLLDKDKEKGSAE
jgi:hypothetical protein